jgi:UDPglucose 6-dehydrogenase
VFVVSNPEFLREGSAVYDCLNPDRIVIGAHDQAAAMRVGTLFQKLQAPLIITDPASSETIKYASNAFLATKISFINAMANVCEVVGADIREVSLGMGYDKRIGFEFLKPGPGWGGSCFVPDETLLVRKGNRIRLLSFAELWDEVDIEGVSGYEALSWTSDGASPEFFPIAAATRRPYNGDIISIRTKMGRRLKVTADHPVVVGDGGDEVAVDVKPAADLQTTDWLPVSLNFPLLFEGDDSVFDILAAAEHASIDVDNLIVRLNAAQRAELQQKRMQLHWSRRRDALRCGTLKVREMKQLGIDLLGGVVSTVTNGTYVPVSIAPSREFWEVIGLFLAEGHIGTDGARKRICWSFHPTDEQHLVDKVANYWTSLGVKVTVRQLATTMQVSISSRVLAAWLQYGLGVGSNSYDKRIPDAIWSAPSEAREALLHGLWEGDGSWSHIADGPSVVLEYGTVSRHLADGMLRLLSSLDIVARLKIGRTTKSTVDTYWISISGEQIHDALFLLPLVEQFEVKLNMSKRTKVIRPTGFRRASNTKSAAWVRVVEAERQHYEGDVFSVEVPGPHTVVTTNGLVTHNCFPKDTKALISIAEEAGYDFAMLRGVVAVNDAQYDYTTAKIRDAVGGSLEGKTVAVWGLTFKANTDDLRDSPSLYVIDRLVAEGAIVKGYDVTQTNDRAPKHPTLDNVQIQADPYAATEGADVLAVLTEWDEFRWLDFEKVKSLLNDSTVVDGRNLLDGAQLRRKGFTYRCVGRP